MTTRPATPGDLGAIMSLERASFPTDAWSEPMMREELTSPHGQYIVVEEAGRLVGYGGVRAPRGGADADIQTIAIADAARGRSRGRALLTELLVAARERGARQVFLEVRADNPVAQRLYASEGFVELGRRPRYYQPDDVDAVVMKLDLAGWAAEPGATRGVSQAQGAGAVGVAAPPGTTHGSSQAQGAAPPGATHGSSQAQGAGAVGLGAAPGATYGSAPTQGDVPLLRSHEAAAADSPFVCNPDERSTTAEGGRCS